MTPALWLLTLVAFGQDEAAPLPRKSSPPLRVVAFEGRPEGACADRTLARKGDCIDVVDFFPLADAVGPRSVSDAERAALGDAGWLYGHVWDDLATRWNSQDVQQTLRTDGYTTVLPTGETWAKGDERGAWSLPRPELALGVGQWLVPDAKPDAPRRANVIFPSVRVATPVGQVTPQATTVLRGRFGQRLGYGGHGYDYDVMDADPSTSGPFFEQLFPYSYSASQRSSNDEVYDLRERIPLVAFRFPAVGTEGGFAQVGAGRNLTDAAKAAGLHFSEFVRAVFVQTSQFAMEDVTTNQMRVLAALTAMATPPGALDGDEGLSRDLVAAARHETDRAEEVLAAQQGQRTETFGQGSHLHTEQIPRVVLARWTPWLQERVGLSDARADALARAVENELGSVLRYGAVPLTDTAAPARLAWVKENVLPGEDLEDTDARVLRIALDLFLDAAPDDLRTHVETWILSEQVRYAIAATFDPGDLATPGDVAAGATEQWRTVLGMHGHPTQTRAQGLGAVDPLSVCTTRDGLDALDEPVFGAITVDQLVAAPDGLRGAAVLESTAEKLPFVFLDDPTMTPTVERLIALGDGRAMYRVSWRVWSGWHLLWGVADQGNGEHRLTLRTAALCSDMVLAPSDIAPTVVRAALLFGNLRPTTPERPGDVPLRKLSSPIQSADDLADQIADTPGQIDEKTKQVGEVQALAEAPPITDMGSLLPKVGEDVFEASLEPLAPVTTWLRDLVHPRLRDLGDHGRLLVYVFDTTAPDKHIDMNDAVPRTPYFRRQSRVWQPGPGEPERDERWVRSASWLWYFSPERPRPVQVSPAFRPKASVAATDRVPRWGRRHALDALMRIGLGSFPYEQVRWRCADSPPSSPNFGGACNGGLESAGASLDLSALAAWWAHDQPRIALDIGAQLQLDLRPAGFAPFQTAPNLPVDDPVTLPSLPWALRFRGGLILGVHGAPGAFPMHKRSSNGRVWGPTASSGSTLLSRMQWGLLGGLLFGPGFNGAEAAASMELWAGWSVARPRPTQGAFPPYRPGVLLGPYVRGSYAFPLAPNESAQQLVLDHGWAAYVGLRIHLRLARPATLPEAP